MAPAVKGGMLTSGMLYVHSAPKALCPHVEWAAGGALGHTLMFQWIDQPVMQGSLRTEVAWQGPIGMGAKIASALRGWEHLRFEVTEEQTAVSDGGRWMHTPDLGIFYAQTDVSGNVVVSEDRIRAAIESAGVNPLQLHREVRLLLGQAWDDELEPFRSAGDSSPVVWLHRVG